MTRRSAAAPRYAGSATIQAIGPDGWAVTERVVDHAVGLVVEEVAAELRAAVRRDTGWQPRIVVLDDRGRDISTHYDVN